MTHGNSALGGPPLFPFFIHTFGRIYAFAYTDRVERLGTSVLYIQFICQKRCFKISTRRDHSMFEREGPSERTEFNDGKSSSTPRTTAFDDEYTGPFLYTVYSNMSRRSPR